MKKLILLIATALLVATTKAEFQTTLFATYDNDGEGEFGSAIALSYYIPGAPLLGFEGVIQRNGFDGDIDEGLKGYGSMIIRYPISKRFTLYAGTGGGAVVNYVQPANDPDDAWFGHAILGAQFALSENLFIDARWREEFKRYKSNDASFYLGIGWKY